MNDVTRLLHQIENGNAAAANDLLPIVYEELRRRARACVANEGNAQSLQATALVHDAYLRLVGKREVQFNGAGHFFGAAAEAMRRILVERARKHKSQKHGGDHERIEFHSGLLSNDREDRLLELDEALDRLQEYDARKAEVVKLRFFAGLTNKETAAALDISTATADRDWTFARSWLHNYMGAE